MAGWYCDTESNPGSLACAAVVDLPTYCCFLVIVQNHLPNKLSLPHNNKAADTDGDGLVDKNEFQEMFDMDGDGQLSKAELEKAAKLFAMVDKDGDGQLTQEELKQVGWEHILAQFPWLMIISCLPRPCLLALNRSSPTQGTSRSRRATTEPRFMHKPYMHALKTRTGTKGRHH